MVDPCCREVDVGLRVRHFSVGKERGVPWRFFFFFFPSFGGYIPAAMDDVSRRLQEVKEVETFHLLDIFRYDLSIPVDHITSYTRRYGMRCKSRVVHTPR